jgi:hypothetical protein
MRNRTLVVTAMIVALATSAPLVAAAAEPAAAASPDSRPDLIPTAPAPAPQDAGRSHWYGWQNLGVDLAAATVVGFGLALDNTPANDAMEKTLIATGAGIYLLGGPLVHLAHHSPQRSGASLAWRVGLPLLGAAGGYLLASPANGDDGPPIRFAISMIGAGAGGVAALVFDDLFLAREQEPGHAPTWAPTLAPTGSGGMTLGVAGLW